MAFVKTSAFAGILPSGASIQNGNVEISAKNNHMQITQNSNKAIIDWDSFSISKANSVHFSQPSRNSSVLNRVVGNEKSTIAGKITATGQVFLVNPNGILFTNTANVNLAGLVASTLDINNIDFLNGKYTFSKNTGTDKNTIENKGSITVNDGGLITLLGGVVKNSGTVTVRLGKIGYGAGDKITVNFEGNQLLSVEVSASTARHIISNTGEIYADGSTVEIKTALAKKILNNIIEISGEVRADTVHNTSGKIVLSGSSVAIAGIITAKNNNGIVNINAFESTAYKDSLIDVSGYQAGQIIHNAHKSIITSAKYYANGYRSGGYIGISSENVGLFNADIQTNGEQAGLVKIGGDFQGGKQSLYNKLTEKQKYLFSKRWKKYGHNLQEADHTYVSSGTNITASGKIAGTVIIWSNKSTLELGKIETNGSKNGAIEISSASKIIDVSLSKVSLSQKGQLLLDPKNIEIKTISSGWKKNLEKIWTINALGKNFTGLETDMLVSKSSGVGENSSSITLGDGFTTNTDGTVIAVGDYKHSNNFGKIYILKRDVHNNGFTLIQSLKGSENYLKGSSTSAIQAGYSLALSGDGKTLVIGSPTHNDNGQVTIFTLNNMYKVTGVDVTGTGTPSLAPIHKAGTNSYGRIVNISPDSLKLFIANQNTVSISSRLNTSSAFSADTPILNKTVYSINSGNKLNNDAYPVLFNEDGRNIVLQEVQNNNTLTQKLKIIHKTASYGNWGISGDGNVIIGYNKNLSFYQLDYPKVPNSTIIQAETSNKAKYILYRSINNTKLGVTKIRDAFITPDKTGIFLIGNGEVSYMDSPVFGTSQTTDIQDINTEYDNKYIKNTNATNTIIDTESLKGLIEKTGSIITLTASNDIYIKEELSSTKIQGQLNLMAGRSVVVDKNVNLPKGILRIFSNTLSHKDAAKNTRTIFLDTSIESIKSSRDSGFGNIVLASTKSIKTKELKLYIGTIGETRGLDIKGNIQTESLTIENLDTTAITIANTNFTISKILTIINAEKITLENVLGNNIDLEVKKAKNLILKNNSIVNKLNLSGEIGSLVIQNDLTVKSGSINLTTTEGNITIESLNAINSVITVVSKTAFSFQKIVSKKINIQSSNLIKGISLKAQEIGIKTGSTLQIENIESTVTGIEILISDMMLKSNETNTTFKINSIKTPRHINIKSGTGPVVENMQIGRVEAHSITINTQDSFVNKPTKLIFNNLWTLKGKSIKVADIKVGSIENKYKLYPINLNKNSFYAVNNLSGMGSDVVTKSSNNKSYTPEEAFNKPTFLMKNEKLLYGIGWLSLYCYIDYKVDKHSTTDPMKKNEEKILDNKTSYKKILDNKISYEKITDDRILEDKIRKILYTK